MSVNWYSGNAAEDGRERRGWIFGHFIDPSEGILLDFSGYRVRVRGRNLQPLFDGLTRHRVSRIQEMDEAGIDLQVISHSAPAMQKMTDIDQRCDVADSRRRFVFTPTRQTQRIGQVLVTVAGREERAPVPRWSSSRS